MFLGLNQGLKNFSLVTVSSGDIKFRKLDLSVFDVEYFFLLKYYQDGEKLLFCYQFQSLKLAVACQEN